MELILIRWMLYWRNGDVKWVLSCFARTSHADVVRIYCCQESSSLAGSSIVKILQNIESVPEKWHTAIRNNGGGYFNHLFYWATMCAGSKGPSEALVNVIIRDFDSFEIFTDHFTTLATNLFGSGYVWLCEDAHDKLHLTTTVNQV